jgi:hypothetical protein
MLIIQATVPQPNSSRRLTRRLAWLAPRGSSARMAGDSRNSCSAADPPVHMFCLVQISSWVDARILFFGVSYGCFAGRQRPSLLLGEFAHRAWRSH